MKDVDMPKLLPLPISTKGRSLIFALATWILH